LLAGCSSSGRNGANPETASAQSIDPKSTLAALPKELADHIESFSQSMIVPDSMPLSAKEELSRVYSEWYRKGYAFAYVSGTECLRGQVPLDYQPDAERAKILGWFDGNSAGGLARRLKEIDSALDRVKASRADNP